MLMLWVKVLLFRELDFVPPKTRAETFKGFMGEVARSPPVLDIQNLDSGGRLSTLLGRMKYDPEPPPPALELRRLSMLKGRSLTTPPPPLPPNLSLLDPPLFLMGLTVAPLFFANKVDSLRFSSCRRRISRCWLVGSRVSKLFKLLISALKLVTRASFSADDFKDSKSKDCVDVLLSAFLCILPLEAATSVLG